MDLDKDLAARQEARALSRQAEKAQKVLSGYSQKQLNEIVEAVRRLFPHLRWNWQNWLSGKRALVMSATR